MMPRNGTVGDPPDDTPPSTEHPPSGRDRAPRKNLFLSATIEAGALKTAVRIRNMSATGAMIDGAALPSVGADLTLRRLAVEIGATVVWRAQGRCGIQFDGAVSIEAWIAGKYQAERSDVRGQARVDAIQAAIRSGTPLPKDTAIARQPPSKAVSLDRRIAEELLYVKRLLDAVGDDLTKDPIMLQRYSRTLQNFDAACQILDHLSTIVGADDPAEAAAAITMQELRARLVGKALF
jgi:hypothetical protein